MDTTYSQSQIIKLNFILMIWNKNKNIVINLYFQKYQIQSISVNTILKNSSLSRNTPECDYKINSGNEHICCNSQNKWCVIYCSFIFNYLFLFSNTEFV